MRQIDAAQHSLWRDRGGHGRGSRRWLPDDGRQPARVDRVSELLAAPLVFGARERSIGGQRREAGMVARGAAGPGRALSDARRSRQRDASATEPAFWRHAPAGRHRQGLRNRARTAVSRRALRRARRVDAREPAAGTHPSLVGHGTDGDDGDDLEQPRRSPAALGPHHPDDPGPPRHARPAGGRRPAPAAQCGAAAPRRTGDSCPDAYRRMRSPITCTRRTRATPRRDRAPRSFPRPWSRPTRARPTHEPHRAARTDGADQGVSHAGRSLRRGEGRQPARSAFRIHLHRRALGLRQVHRALDHRRPSTGHARRRRHQGTSDDRARRRQGRRISDALPAAVVDRQGKRPSGREAEVPPLEGPRPEGFTRNSTSN